MTTTTTGNSKAHPWKEIPDAKPDLVKKASEVSIGLEEGYVNVAASSSPKNAISDRFTPYVHEKNHNYPDYPHSTFPEDDEDDGMSHVGGASGQGEALLAPTTTNPNETDTVTLGHTVASSTYGEDRQKVSQRSLLDPYGDKGTYTGVVLRTTGMPHGQGTMVYEEDGRVYEGDWRHGRWHGFGKAAFSNGDSYEGEYKFDQRHGKGVYKWNDGRVYDGTFAEDKRHGNGVFAWPDGAVYEGDFVKGQREGHGAYSFADGGRYEGSWKDGRYDGFGRCTWEDGREYRGEWRNGMAHGHGTETYPDGTIRHEGQWIDDEPIR